MWKDKPEQLRYIPEILPGELLSSVLVRMLWHQADQISLREWIRKYQPRPRLLSVFASDLESINHLMPPDWRFDEKWVTQNCCILPFLSPFLTPEVRQAHLERVSKAPSYDRRKVDQFPSRPWLSLAPLTTVFRACPQCAREDLEQYGEPYLHRIHHLPGIDLCLKHGSTLTPMGKLTTSVQTLTASLHGLIEVATKKTAPPRSALVNYLLLAVEHLMRRPIVAQENLDFRPLYLLRIRQMGFKLNLDRKGLLEPIRKQYQTVSQQFYIEGWLSSRLKNYLWGSVTELPPIAHLILHHFLHIDLQDSLKYANEGLWHCCNPVTECGPTKLAMAGTEGRSYLVSCDHCGFSARIDNRSPLGQKPPIKAILQRGAAFDSTVMKLRASGAGYTELGKSLGLDKRTVRTVLKKIQALTAKLSKPASADYAYHFEVLLKSRRKLMGDWIQAHPGTTRTEIMKAMPGVFPWLRRHDRVWLEEHLPKKMEHKGRFQKRKKSHLRWEKTVF